RQEQMIEPLRVVFSKPRREDFFFPHASQQLKSFELPDCLAQPQLARELPIARQVMFLNQILPKYLRRHRLDPPPQSFEGEPMNSGEEAAFAPLHGFLTLCPWLLALELSPHR